MYFEFLTPTKVIAGDDAIFKLPFELEQAKANKPIVLTDKGIVGAGILSNVKLAFEEYKLEMPTVFDDIPPETSVESVQSAFKIFKNENCDSIVAVGGGSVIDTAKALRMMVAENNSDLMGLAGADNLSGKGPVFIAVPTTSGTGSEVTSVAVIYDSKSSSKIAFASDFLIPDIAILDPVLTVSLPKKLTAASGIDALSHAIEAYIGIQSNHISKALSFKAVEMIFNNLIDAIANGKDKKVRLNMLIASTIAGMAFSNSMVGVVHSLAHASGAVLHIPHGVAISLFLEAGLRENFNKCKKEYSELLNTVKCDFLGDEENRANEFLKVVGDFLKEVRRLSGIPSGLKEVGYTKETEKRIIELAISDGSSIFNKIELTEEVARRMIQASL